MTTQLTAPTSLVQQAQLVAIANRQRLLNREQEERTVKKAVRNVLKEIK